MFRHWSAFSQASPKDIEDLAAAGRLAHTCPYFGSRRAIPQAEVILEPSFHHFPSQRVAYYSWWPSRIIFCSRRRHETLLASIWQTRLSSSMKPIVSNWIYEACAIIHFSLDLISTILSLSTTRLPFHTLDTSLFQVSIYLSKFRTRLSANHVLHLKRLITFLEAFKRYSTDWLEAAKGKKQLDGRVEVMTVAELMQRLGRRAESINMLEIESYLRSSKVMILLSQYRI